MGGTYGGGSLLSSLLGRLSHLRAKLEFVVDGVFVTDVSA